MSTLVGASAPSGGVRVNGRSPWVWALRRAAMAVVILTLTVGGAAWLLYAAIDPDPADAATTSATAASATGTTQARSQ